MNNKSPTIGKSRLSFNMASSESKIFETCSAKYSTDQLDSLLSCINDGRDAVSGSSSPEFMKNMGHIDALQPNGSAMLSKMCFYVKRNST